MASGIAHRLFMANINRICMTEIEYLLCVGQHRSFLAISLTGKWVCSVVGKSVQLLGRPTLQALVHRTKGTMSLEQTT